jgi:hypothetical protein
MVGCGLDSSGSGSSTVTGFYEHGNGLSVTVQCEELFLPR